MKRKIVLLAAALLALVAANSCYAQTPSYVRVRIDSVDTCCYHPAHHTEWSSVEYVEFFDANNNYMQPGPSYYYIWYKDLCDTVGWRLDWEGYGGYTAWYDGQFQKSFPGCCSECAYDAFNLYVKVVVGADTLTSPVVRLPDNGTGSLQQTHRITADQKRQNNTSIGYVGLFNVNRFNNYPAPFPFGFLENSNQTVKSSQSLVFAPVEKYNQWNSFSDVTNPQSFLILRSLGSLVSNFKPVDTTGVIQMALVDGPIPSGPDSIDFQDPWLVDTTDQRFYGLHGWQNLGMFAPYKRVASSYRLGLGTKFKGVFLNQSSPPSWPQPYYSVSVPQADTIAGFPSRFQYWSVTQGDASFKNPLDSQTGVVFKLNNTTVSAKYKAHLGSSSSLVTAPTMQRRVIRDENGVYHMAYESGGSIWYARSTDGGANWSNEKVLFSAGASYSYRSPSITVQNTPHLVVVVAEYFYTDGSGHGIQACTVNPTTGAVTDEGGIGYPYNGIPQARPVVASGVASTGTNYCLAVWYDSLGHLMKASVRQSGPSWSAETNLRWGLISSISLSPITAGGGYSWHLIWYEGMKLHYAPIVIASTPALGATGADSIVATAAEDGCIFSPSAADLQFPGGQPAVAWEDFDGEMKHVIKYREHDPRSGGSWGTVQVFSKTAMTVNYVTPTLTGHSSTPTVSIAWRDGTSQLKYVQRKNGSWTSQTNLATGVDPTSSVGWQAPSNELILYRGTSTPYPILHSAVTYGQQKIDAASVEPEGRGGNLIFQGGKLGLAIEEASVDGTPLTFVAIDDTVPVTSVQQFLAALQSNAFPATGMLKLYVGSTAAGNLPPESGFRLVLRDASNGQRLGVIRTYGITRDTVTSLVVSLGFSGKYARLAVEALGTAVPLAYEIERWHMVQDAGAMVKSGGEPGTTIVRLLPTEFSLRPNYPNPFNPSTTINFELPENGNIMLVICDVLGREVATLAQGYREAGYHSVVWDARSAASGVYYARFTATDEFGKVKYNKVNKLLLMK